MIEHLSININSFPCKSCGLGDLLAIFYALENIGNQQSILFNIKINNSIDFFECLDFKNIILTDKNGEDLIKKICDFPKEHKCKKNLGFFNGYFFINSLTNYLNKKYQYDPILAKPIKPKIIFPQKKITSTQFDSRSMKKRKISNYKIKKILKKENNVFCIGGKDTSRYLGDEFSYCTGDISYLIKKIQSCNKFIGSDSGMSHLAGVLAIESHVYMKDYCGCLRNYYLESYRNCRVFNFKIF